LAFYASVGFLAGFNERFAQDMVAGSAQQLNQRLAAAGNAPTSGGTPPSSG
jgi:hypothetical protein